LTRNEKFVHWTGQCENIPAQVICAAHFKESGSLFERIDLLNILKSLILINVLMVSLDAIKAHCGLI